MKVTKWEIRLVQGRVFTLIEASIHVSAHGLHYGSSIFEGIPAYETEDGTAVFRLQEHVARHYNSCKISHMEVGIKWSRSKRCQGAVN